MLEEKLTPEDLVFVSTPGIKHPSFTIIMNVREKMGKNEHLAYTPRTTLPICHQLLHFECQHILTSLDVREALLRDLDGPNAPRPWFRPFRGDDDTQRYPLLKDSHPTRAGVQ